MSSDFTLDLDFDDDGDLDFGDDVDSSSSPPPTNSKPNPAKNKMLEFYGIKTSDRPSSVPDRHPEDVETAGTEAAPPVSTSPLDLDSPHFDSSLYLRNLLNSYGLRELIEKDNDLISSRKFFDSKMQHLVYSNYNKFISATDIIRIMRGKVELMEERYGELKDKIATIATKATSIEGGLAPNREKVENLVGVSRLLSRLEFLFELPKRLTSSISIGAYEEAVRYYKISSTILATYGHIQSFSIIRNESSSIIVGLKNQLKSLILDIQTSIERQIHYSSLLIDLNEDPKELVIDIIKTRAQQLRKEIAKINEKVALSQMKSSTALSPKGGGGGGGGGGDSGGIDVLSLAAAAFIEPFSIFATTFINSLVKPHQNYDNANRAVSPTKDKDKVKRGNATVATAKPNSPSKPSGASPNAGDISTFYQESLIKMTHDVFTDFFNLIRGEILRQGTLYSPTLNQSSPSLPLSSLPNDKLVEFVHSTDLNAFVSHIAASHLSSFTMLVSRFYSCMSPLFTMLPSSNLQMKSNEIIENGIRHVTIQYFNIGQLQMYKVIKEVADASDAFETTGNMELKPAGIAASIREIFEALFAAVGPLVDPQHYVREMRDMQGRPAEMKESKESSPSKTSPATSPFGIDLPSIIVFAFHSQWAQLVDSLLCQIPRKSSGPIYHSKTTSAHSRTFSSTASASIGVSDSVPILNRLLPSLIHLVSKSPRPPPPLFALLLSHSYLHIEGKEYALLIKSLRKSFLTSASITESSMLEQMAKDQIIRMKENAHLMMSRYVEMHGRLVVERIRERLRGRDNQTQYAKGDPLVVWISQRIFLMTRELDLVFKQKGDVLADGSSSGGSSTPGTESKVGHPATKATSTPTSSRSLGVSTAPVGLAHLFSVHLSTFTAVKFNVVDPQIAFWRIILKTVIETIRDEPPVTSDVAHRLHLEAAVIHRMIPWKAISTSTSADSQNVLIALLEEVKHVAKTRMELAKSATPSDVEVGEGEVDNVWANIQREKEKTKEVLLKLQKEREKEKEGKVGSSRSRGGSMDGANTPSSPQT